MVLGNGDGGGSVATPFELWCERNGLWPDDPDAWERYCLSDEGARVSGVRAPTC